MSESSLPEQDVLPGLIRSFFSGSEAEVRVLPVAGAAVVEIIDSRVTPEKATAFANWLFDEIGKYNGRVDKPDRVRRGIGIHRLFMYASYVERFAVDAILRTIPPGYDPNGVWTSTLAANDAIVSMAEAEVEVLLLGHSGPLPCSAIAKKIGESDLFIPSEGKAPLYRGVDVGGCHYRFGISERVGIQASGNLW